MKIMCQPLLSLNLSAVARKLNKSLKNPAYGRHWISWPMRIVSPLPWKKKKIWEELKKNNIFFCFNFFCGQKKFFGGAPKKLFVKKVYFLDSASKISPSVLSKMTSKIFFPKKQTELLLSKSGFLEISWDLATLFLTGWELKLIGVQSYQQIWLFFNP